MADTELVASAGVKIEGRLVPFPRLISAAAARRQSRWERFSP